MPGRHSGGSGLGGGGMRGGGGGMRGGGLGGGYRGGGGGGFGRGFGGGGYRGPGWGGGWRGPGWGGFGWRGIGPFGWGWVSPWRWFGYGGGGGGGCFSGIGCLMLLIVGGIFACLALSSGFGRGGGFTYNNTGPYNNNDSVSSSGNGSGQASLANESAAIQTQTALDLTELHTAFDSRIAAWETQLSNNVNLSVPPADAGLTQDNNTQAVLYGKCGSALYVYVIDKTKPDSGPANGEGYVYTTASSPGACHPPQWTVYDSEDVGGGWYFATLQSVNS